MGVIYRMHSFHTTLAGADLTTAEFFGTDDVLKCSFCGEYATGYWQGVEARVSCCRQCAMNVLPALMADTICGESGCMHTEAVAALKAVESRFWRGMACATDAVRRRRRIPPTRPETRKPNANKT